MGYRVGIDVGGTFTDFALYDEAAKQLSIHKVLSTGHDPSIAVLGGLDDLQRALVLAEAPEIRLEVLRGQERRELSVRPAAA